MSAKKQPFRSRLTQFSSDDSQNTDYSMDSSFEITETAAQNDLASKFNQLKESINQLFLANPDLAEEIKFDKYAVAENPADPEKANASSASPIKQAGAFNGPDEAIPSANTFQSAKYWTVISKEMVMPQKNSKLPSLSQINHVLNLFKAKFDQPEQKNSNLSPTKVSSILKKSKNDFRIQSAKSNGEKYSNGKGNKDSKAYLQGISSPQNPSQSLLDEEEDGVAYYSFRKKMHLQLKHKRMQKEAEEEKLRKEYEAEQEKLAKELEERKKNVLRVTMDYARGAMGQALQPNEDTQTVDNTTSKNNTTGGYKMTPKSRTATSRRHSLKAKGGDIFDRLTKDVTKQAQADPDEDNGVKKNFSSAIAETLYKDMKSFGDAEAFKKIAQARIANYKREFKEKLAKQKQMPLEGVKFTKDKSRYLNVFVPDFERGMAIPNKDAIFALNEVHRDSEEWRENPEHEILSKFQKMLNGNILSFWQDLKDLNH